MSVERLEDFIDNVAMSDRDGFLRWYADKLICKTMPFAMEPEAWRAAYALWKLARELVRAEGLEPS